MRCFYLFLAFLIASLGTCMAATASTPSLLQEDEAPIISQRQQADRVVVLKSKRKLYLYANGEVIDEFNISLGKHPTGPKTKRGDMRTPEGKYKLDWRNAASQYYRAIHISYPNVRDINHASRFQLDPGDAIMIHGQPNNAILPRKGDWTDGCIAVSDADMDRLWQRTPNGIPIYIYP